MIVVGEALTTDSSTIRIKPEIVECLRYFSQLELPEDGNVLLEDGPLACVIRHSKIREARQYITLIDEG